MAYGARLESVLGATPREFESRILRPETGTGRAHCGHPDCRSQIRSPSGCGSESLSMAAVVDVDDEYGGVRVKSSRQAVCRVDLKVDPSCTGDLVVPGRDGAFGCALEFADAAVRRLLVGSCSEVVPQLRAPVAPTRVTSSFPRSAQRLTPASALCSFSLSSSPLTRQFILHIPARRRRCRGRMAASASVDRRGVCQQENGCYTRSNAARMASWRASS